MLKKTLISALTVAIIPFSTLGCTLWGAAGAPAGGGTLISKNRDWRPDHTQYLKLVRPKEGFSYFGLHVTGNDAPGLKAGVNQKGLTIVSASSNIPAKVRKAQLDVHGVVLNILRNYETVDALVADAPKLFSHARANHFMVADRTKIVVVEVGLDGRYALTVTQNGPATHTNHYVDPDLAATYNHKSDTGSEIRLARVNALLNQSTRPFTVDQFSAISRDQHDGADHSLWRKGKTQTMASWIIASPKAGPQQLRVVIANPGQAIQTQEFVLDKAFWSDR